MDEKDDIMEKQIANAMINSTGSVVNHIDNGMKDLEKRATVTESKLNILESDIDEIEDSIELLKSEMATRQDLENQRKEIEDEFKGMLTKSMYIVFVLVFIAILFGYFF